MFVRFQDPGSLDNLNDIVVNDPVPRWPPAAGWYVLGILLFAAAVLLMVKTIQRWRSNAYRRAALAELQSLRELDLTSTQPAQTIADIDRIVKRTALARWPRETVAPLSGERWVKFLNDSVKADLFSSEDAEAFIGTAYSSKLSSQLSHSRIDQIIDAAITWVRTHQAPEPEPHS